MGRIRTIKPEFFKHELLYDAEMETGLPLRIAFAGLWTQCDREGRFKWKPRALKSDILPYDDLDFSRVLDALATRGLLVSYASPTGDQIGFIPSFTKHQVINNKERGSELPSYEECSEVIDIQEDSNALATRESRDDHAYPETLNLSQGEQGTRNKEQGKEKEKIIKKENPRVKEHGTENNNSFSLKNINLSKHTTGDSLFQKVCRLVNNPQVFGQGQVVKEWQEIGASDQLVLDVIEGVMKRSDKQISSLRYFDDAMRDKVAEEIKRTKEEVELMDFQRSLQNG